MKNIFRGVRKSILTTGLVGMLAANSFMGCEKSTRTEKLEGNYKIAFMSERDGNTEIYVINPDEYKQKRLTNNPAYDNFPS